MVFRFSVDNEILSILKFMTYTTRVKLTNAKLKWL